MKNVVSIAALCLLVGAAQAQVTSMTTAYETGTIQLTGPRPPSNGDNFFNIEGSINGAFVSYGVARFDLGDVQNSFNIAFGAGNWEITSVELQLTQEHASFSADGAVRIYFSPDDIVDCKTALSPLVYPLFDVPGVPDLALGNNMLPVCEYFFVDGVTGDINAYNQVGGPAGGGEAFNLVQDLLNDLTNDLICTLVFEDADAGVAATYRGQSEFMGRIGPTFVITAEQAGGGCYPDCDMSGSLDFFDFLCFQNEFSLGSSYADCDGSGSLDFFDFLCFQNAFAVGCP